MGFAIIFKPRLSFVKASVFGSYLFLFLTMLSALAFCSNSSNLLTPLIVTSSGFQTCIEKYPQQLFVTVLPRTVTSLPGAQVLPGLHPKPGVVVFSLNTQCLA